MKIESKSGEWRDGNLWVRITYWDGENVYCQSHGNFKIWDIQRSVNPTLMYPGRCPICLRLVQADIKTVEYPEGCIFIDIETEREL